MIIIRPEHTHPDGVKICDESGQKLGFHGATLSSRKGLSKVRNSQFLHPPPPNVFIRGFFIFSNLLNKRFHRIKRNIIQSAIRVIVV